MPWSDGEVKIILMVKHREVFAIRYTGVQIYRSGIEDGPESKEERQAEEDIIDDYECIQKQIGGTEAWSKLLHELYRPLTSTNW